MTTTQFVTLAISAFFSLAVFWQLFAVKGEIKLSLDVQQEETRDAQAFAAQWNRDPRKATELSRVVGYPSCQSYDDARPFALDYPMNDRFGFYPASKEPNNAA